MPLPTMPVPKFATDPGVLLWAPLATAEPAHAVTGAVFSDTWDAAFIVLGATDGGHTFNYQTSFGTIEFAEFLDPIAYKAEGRTGSVVFALGDIVSANLRRALNGGTLTSTGTGLTKMTKFDPPALGQETRCMLGWESQDSTERYVWRQCINTGQISITRNKGAGNRTTIPCEFSLEVPASGALPWQHVAAGARA